MQLFVRKAMQEIVTPKLLSGFRDLLPKDAIIKKTLLRKLERVFESFGFVPIETPHLEYTQMLLGHAGDDLKKEIYRFRDHGDRDIMLRFDQTVPLARFISQHKNDVSIPFKRYAIGNVFRGERAQKGRYREFTQCDFDFIGSDSLNCDAEIIQVIYQALSSLGLDDFIIWINHRQILNGICKYFSITKQEDIESVIRIVDKIDKIGVQKLKEELASSIDNLSSKKIEGLVDLVSIKQTKDFESFLADINHMKSWNCELEAGISELERVFNVLSRLQVDKDSYRVNFAIARGLGYYTGIIYETIISNLHDLGSVCSGGRYDNLSEMFSKEKLSGVGASIGLDRLIAGLMELEILDSKRTTATILVSYADDRFAKYAYEIGELFRNSGVNIEVYPEATKFKKQFSYANQKGHEFVLVVDEKELSSKTMTLKNMQTGLQMECLSFLKVLEIIKD